MLRMRTIEKSHEHIKALDPDTALTKYALRQKVISGEIPSRKCGGKYLINLDVLEAYLGATDIPIPQPDTYTSGKMRPIDE